MLLLALVQLGGIFSAHRTMHSLPPNARVLVTGASSGLGEALAQRFSTRHYRLILSARRGDVLRTVATRCLELGAAAAEVVELDQSDLRQLPARIDAILATFDGLDLAILNAGVSSRSSALDTQLDTLERIMTVNFVSQAEIARRVACRMVSDGTQGRIVAISSVQAYFGLPMRSSYAASKHALHGYFDALRAELASTGISVTVCAPGYIRTELSENALTADGSAYGVTDHTTASGADPREVADCVIAAAETRQTELLAFAGLSATLARYLRLLAPSFLFAQLASRAQRDTHLTRLLQDMRADDGVVKTSVLDDCSAPSNAAQGD